MNSVRLRRTETESVGTLLLSIWLIAAAVLLLAKVSFANEGVILAILAAAAGVLLVLRQSSDVGWSNSASQHEGDVPRRGRRVSANLGILVLSLWLIVTAVLFLTKISFANQEMILAVLAITAGVLLLLRQGGMSPNLGWLLLSAWLIVQGAMVLFSLSFGQSEIVMAVLALAAGVLILLRR
jgi:hypothetical protein